MKRLVKVSPRNVPISKTRPRGVNAVAKLAKCVIYLMDPSRCRDYACINLDAALQRNREGGWLSHAQAGRPSFMPWECRDHLVQGSAWRSTGRDTPGTLLPYRKCSINARSYMTGSPSFGATRRSAASDSWPVRFASFFLNNPAI